jgi:serine/threonine-protein kinase 24/25/MST4
MADEGVANHYQVLEELGRESRPCAHAFTRCTRLIDCRRRRQLRRRVQGHRQDDGGDGRNQARRCNAAFPSVVGHALTSIAAQIDLESSEDDIQEIQQEISVLSTCASSYVTQYKASFLRGHKLWIVMEYLGGGSCLDLVCIRATSRRSG